MFTTTRITACIVLAAALVCVTPAGDDAPKAEEHRAFRPVARPNVPDARGAARTSIDRFVLAAAEAKRLTLSPEADRDVLIRRVCFDLTGLPPTPAEIADFLADDAPDAYERLVKRYLASPRYGE